MEKKRPFPGLNSVLEALDMPEFMTYYKNAVNKNEGIEAKETIFTYLNDKKLSQFIDNSILSSTLKEYQKNWFIKLDDENKRQLIETVLCRIDLKTNQIKHILDNNREQNNIYSAIDHILDNPFILQEEYIGNCAGDHINFEKIDHAVLPSQEINLDILVAKDDHKRLRALIVDYLKNVDVHSFIDQETILEKVNQKMNVYPEWKNIQFNKGYIDFEKDFFEENFILELQKILLTFT